MSRPPAIVDGSPLLPPHEEAALMSIAPLKSLPAIEKAREVAPEAVLASEDWLRRYSAPDERDERLRLSFWNEFNNVTAGMNSRRMHLGAILHGICSETVWDRVYLRNPVKLLWVITPPKSYSQSMNYILHLGTERLIEIMSLPIKDNGKVDHKAANLILKAFELVDMRVKGGILQKMQVEQKNLNVNLSAESEQLKGIDDLDKLQAMSAMLQIEASEGGSAKEE